MRRFWRDPRRRRRVWLVGSYATSMPYALLAAARGKRVAFGIRQDLPRYARGRHPDRRWCTSPPTCSRPSTAASPASSRSRSWARTWPSASAMRRGCSTCPSRMIRERDVVDVEQALERPYDGELVILNVGRVDMEKNPLLLADVLAAAARARPALAAGRVRRRPDAAGPRRPPRASSGVAEHADLRGYVTLEDGLLDIYRSSHAFLHVSWTEGPAADHVRGVRRRPAGRRAPPWAACRSGVGDAALLMPPGDAEAAVGGARADRLAARYPRDC